jgi:hypothetical protein
MGCNIRKGIEVMKTAFFAFILAVSSIVVLASYTFTGDLKTPHFSPLGHSDGRPHVDGVHVVR